MIQRCASFTALAVACLLLLSVSIQPVRADSCWGAAGPCPGGGIVTIHCQEGECISQCDCSASDPDCVSAHWWDSCQGVYKIEVRCCLEME
jgi:hypothetical protein